MIPKEQEIAINELEERVDRLRNLYEQYFLGFERLEPTVPRKDVDRRLAILRKEQIRNTALRFRFNVVTQKYNTYAMHWVRICRQIEEGTYKRHVRRAKARFGELSSASDRDLSIDIDNFDMSMDEVLAEANVAAERFERPPPDSVPPPPTSERSPAARPIVPPTSERTTPSARAITATPATAFVAGAPSPRPADRMARPAALPPGTKPRILVRKREEGDQGPAAVRSPAPSSPQFVAGAPPSDSAASAGQPVAPAAGGAPAIGRQPVAPHGMGAGGSSTGPQIRPVGSGGRMPVARPPGSAPGPSAPRVPVAAPASRPDPLPAGPAPVPPPSGPKLPAPPGSSPRLPVPPPTQPGRPGNKKE